MRISDVMSREVRLVHPEIKADELSKKMKQFEIGVMPVVKDDRVVGIVTDRDIVIRAIAEGKNPDAIMARDIMSTDIVTVSRNEDLMEAGKLMKNNKVRRLVVLDDDKQLAGMFSMGDLATAYLENEFAGEVLEEVSSPGKDQ